MQFPCTNVQSFMLLLYRAPKHNAVGKLALVLQDLHGVIIAMLTNETRESDFD